MSHEDIASVWSTLSGRQDISNVLRELIGTHYLNVSLARRDSSRLREALLSHIVTLRVILDLQRTYLQSSVRSADCTSSVLPPELLFAAVLHLLDVIMAGTISCPDLSNEGPYNRLTIHTTLAGLRTLLLRRKSASARELDLLSNRFEEICERGHWHGTEYTLMLRLCRQVIQMLIEPAPEGRYTEPACYEASLPDFFSGLYLLQSHESSIMDASRRIGFVSLQSSEWFCQLLTLYDLFWSTTAALIQLCLVRRQVAETDPETSTLDKALRLVLSIRYRLRKQAYASPGWSHDNRAAEQFLGLMLQDIRLECTEEICRCLEPDSNIVQEMVCCPLRSRAVFPDL